MKDPPGNDGEFAGELRRLRLQVSRLEDLNSKLSHESAESHSLQEVPYRRIVESAREGIWTFDRTGRTTFVNSKLASMLGYTAGELIGRRLEDFLHDTDDPDTEWVVQPLKSAGGEQIDLRLKCKDGSVLETIASPGPLLDGDGRFTEVLVMLCDVTPRSSAHAFQAGYGKVLELLATAQPLDRVLDRLVRVMEAQSPGMRCSVLSYDENSRRLNHVAAPSLPDDYNRAIDGVEIGPGVGSCGTAAHRGERVIVEDIETDSLWEDYRDLARKHGLRASWSQPLFASNGDLLGTFAMYYGVPRRPNRRDFDLIEVAARLAAVAIERKRDEQRLRESESHLRQVLDLVPHMIFAKDGDGNFLLANAAVADAYGTSVQALIGRGHASVHHTDEELARMLADDREVIERGEQKFIPEEEFTDSKGRVHLLQTTKIPFRQSVSKQPAMLGVAIDITERRELERRVSLYERNLERFFLDRSEAVVGMTSGHRQLLDSASDFYVTLDAQQRITTFNRSLTATLGYSRAEVLGRRLDELMSPACRLLFRDAMNRARESNEIQDLDCHLVRVDGSTVEVGLRARLFRTDDDAFEPTRVVLRDLTRRRNLQQQLVRTEQLVTTGRLAASVAHEINNPLQGLLLNLSIVGDALSEDFAEHESWSRIHEAVALIQRVANDLLDLHRVGRGRPERIDINALVREALGLAASQLRANGIEQVLDLDESLPAVRGMPQHLYQVLLNLFLNGAEAMPNGGLLRISTQVVAGMATIAVEDNGPGISSEDLPHIFDPLYIGRKSQGTGLGLFVTYNLVKEHDGDIDVESELGRGTRMRVSLPLVDELE